MCKGKQNKTLLAIGEGQLCFPTFTGETRRARRARDNDDQEAPLRRWSNGPLAFFHGERTGTGGREVSFPTQLFGILAGVAGWTRGHASSVVHQWVIGRFLGLSFYVFIYFDIPTILTPWLFLEAVFDVTNQCSLSLGALKRLVATGRSGTD